MLLDEPTVDIDDFERGTGWTIRPEGACRGDICVSLPAESIHHGTVDVVAVAAAMGFWQDPTDDDPEAWPYDGDRLTHVREIGAENYYPEWRPSP